MPEVRVATYNLYLGADLSLVFLVEDEEQLRERTAEVHRQLRATDSASRAGAVAGLLVRERVDLVGLQEVTRWTAGGEVCSDHLAELTAALAGLGEPYDVHAVNAGFGGSGQVAEGVEMTVAGCNAILRRRSSAVEVVAESTGTFTDALRVPTLPGHDVPIVRGWSRVDLHVGGAPLAFVNTHTEAYDARVRAAQRDEMLASLGPGPVVVVGDFNAVPEEVGMPAGFVDAWVAAGDGTDGFTCGQAPDLANSTSSLGQRIDYVWVRDAAVTSCRLVGHESADRTEGGLWPSDHAGVVAAVEVAAPG
jgi:endonuclease/exonuclease/phosphatase family metal-dependent hydrolase